MSDDAQSKTTKTRTIGGYEFEAWLSFPSADRLKAYRAAGVRCRRFGSELFVYTMDTDDAKKVDARLEAAST